MKMLLLILLIILLLAVFRRGRIAEAGDTILLAASD
jgi:hypothetical protein